MPTTSDASADAGVARVLVDVPLAHLDRPFDYAVPPELDAAARPGVRVKVRFAGRLVSGYVVARVPDSAHEGRLTPLNAVVSPEVLLTPAVEALTAAVAARYAGARSDVLRLAIPPRHAAAERAEPKPLAEPPTIDLADAERRWAEHPPGPAYVRALARGESPRAVWTAAPATDWPALVAGAAASTLAGGRGTLVVVPDGRDVDRVDQALTQALGTGHHVALQASSGPRARYRDFLLVSRGRRRVVVGTRAAAFAPVHDLGLVVIWDDGDDLHAEPRAPYPHAREVLLLRAEQEHTAALVGGHACTVEGGYLVRTGWARLLAATRETLRERVGVAVAGSDDRTRARDPAGGAARIPREVHDLLKDADGPVLVQTPRAGYAAALACARCRAPATCSVCRGPLRLTGPTRPPVCRWCGHEEAAWACAECGHRGLRAPVVGDLRTAEELGRSLPGRRVQTSGAGHVLARVEDEPGIVVATPGAEPVAEAGYAAVVLLDTWLSLARADLRVAEEALRRWLNAAALVRPGGHVLAVGDPAQPALQALVRWDPVGFAERETAERQAAHLPPASRLATVTGEPDAVVEALAAFAPPADCEVLGPVPVDEAEVRTVLRVPRARGAQLSEALGTMLRIRSARKLAAVRVQVDPPSLS